jgi:hypothetical protein
VAAVAADDAGHGRLAYYGGSPREALTPKGQPEENALSFFSGASQQRRQAIMAKYTSRKEPNREVNEPDKGAAKETIVNQTAKETVLEISAARRHRTPIGWRSANDRNWLSFFDRSQLAGVVGSRRAAEPSPAIMAAPVNCCAASSSPLRGPGFLSYEYASGG